jgi:hypothetical protein
MVDDILVLHPSVAVYMRRARAATASSGLVAGRWVNFGIVSACVIGRERSPETYHCS